jgi:hypothetical protein
MYCGARPPAVGLVVDHFIARVHGGSDDDWNLISACEACNFGKADTYTHYTCPTCPRPTCGGPRTPRDLLEVNCGCDCHLCTCGNARCPGLYNVVKCPQYISFHAKGGEQ